METGGEKGPDSFKDSSTDFGDWIMKGVDFFDDYLTSRGKHNDLHQFSLLNLNKTRQTRILRTRRVQPIR